MKKLLFLIMLLIIMPLGVRADQIYNMDIDIFVEENGSAHITEIWEVQASEGTEWCKLLSNMEAFEISDLYVQMDGTNFEKKNWNEKESLKDKAGAYGIKETSKGIELCFGKTDMERHRFQFGYNVSNYIINTSDGQVLYHVLGSKVNSDIFYADIMTYYSIPDNFEVWGYGYNGNSYVENGRLVFSKYEKLNDEYVVALAKFPAGTFKTEYKIGKFNSFDSIVKDAKNAGYEYTNKRNFKFRVTFLDFVFVLLSIFVILLIVEFIVRNKTGKSLLKNEKVLKVLNKVKEVLKKLFWKVKSLCKKIFPKVLVFFKKLFRKIKFLFKKIFKKKNKEQ